MTDKDCQCEAERATTRRQSQRMFLLRSRSKRWSPSALGHGGGSWWAKPRWAPPPLSSGDGA